MDEEDFKEGFTKFWNSAMYFIFDISSNCRHFNGSPLVCPINATFSFSYVFRLQHPRVLHCRIVPIEKLKILVVFGRKNPPVNHLGSKYKTNHLKVTRNLRENFSWTYDRGGDIFTKLNIFYLLYFYDFW
jgi:hypothetical protein